MLRRLWPSSLYGQILFVAALAMLLAQMVNTTLLILANNGRATVEASSMLVARVANQVERRRLTDDDNNARPPRNRPPSISLIISDEPLNPAGFASQGELAERASEYLLAVDPQISSIRLSKGPIGNLPPTLRAGPMRRWADSFGGREGRDRPSEAVLLTMKMVDGRWVNAAAPVRTKGPFPPFALLFQTLVLYLAVLIPLALVARRIARPLKAVTERVGDAGLASDRPAMEPKGPSDVRELIEAFNTAEARLSSLLTEKDVMLGAIGHDLKTPLASLRVRIENVEDEADREKMAATVDEMVTILDDILIFARLGKSAEDIQQTDLSALVETVISDFPDDSKISFEPAKRIVAPVRPVLIRRALRNLVNNALQYGGNARLQLRAETKRLCIIVDDNGPGIAPDQLDTIFEPFARAESSRNRALGGTGLGLTIARAIARAHGGDVTLRNRSDGGVEALLWLPS
jgi:signal transduction histidine kinase